MAAKNMQQLRSEIEARLRELAPAQLEYDELTAIQSSITRVTHRSLSAPDRAVPSARRHGRARYAGGARRAGRGSNRAAIVRALANGPRAASDLARATGIAPATLATTLSQMKAKGLLDNQSKAWGLTPAGTLEVSA